MGRNAKLKHQRKEGSFYAIFNEREEFLAGYWNTEDETVRKWTTHPSEAKRYYDKANAIEVMSDIIKGNSQKYPTLFLMQVTLKDGRYAVKEEHFLTINPNQFPDAVY